MPFGLTNSTIPTMQNITDIANVTSVEGIFVNINHIVFNGYLYFALLWVLWIILYFAGQDNEDQPLVNMMYSGAVVTIVSFVLRAITVVNSGVVTGMLSDKHMWIFALITSVLAGIVWMSKD